MLLLPYKSAIPLNVVLGVGPNLSMYMHGLRMRTCASTTHVDGKLGKWSRHVSECVETVGWGLGYRGLGVWGIGVQGLGV